METIIGLYIGVNWLYRVIKLENQVDKKWKIAWTLFNWLHRGFIGERGR